MDSRTRLQDRRDLLTGAGVGAWLLSSNERADAEPTLEANGRFVNVRDFGAKGDAQADDSESFLRAIDQGRVTRCPVLVPDGRYRLSRPLSVPPQGLVGNPWGSWVADVVSLPVLLPENMDSPALTTEAGGSIAGIEVRYPNPDPRSPIQRPSAIRLGETGATVRCVKITNPWVGIDTQAVHTNPGRTVVENVFVSAAHKTGVHFTGAADVCLFRNVEVWTPPSTSSTFLAEGTAFHFQRGDGIRITDCFAFGANEGFLFTESEVDGPLAGVFTGYLSNCLSDFCNTGIELRGDHRVTITGGSNWSHGSCIRLEEGASTLLASAVEMASNAYPGLFVGSAKDVVLQGCRLERPHADFRGPAIQISGGDRINLQGNTIRSHTGPAVLVDATEGSLLMQANILEGGLELQESPNLNARVEGNLEA
ncbi:MAG: glycosyl hydrolase family 28-related protein [Planctomycetota bacterium]